MSKYKCYFNRLLIKIKVPNLKYLSDIIIKITYSILDEICIKKKFINSCFYENIINI